ncbi:DEKNAAC104020 [Brettanomyces naardenensis]|uniref:DEKNAAC104020 n=1 Tax=Brettanomyces naardenensis TaxID=13370 RepID=A0A448YQ04_BRENA|nr:DEKNAAC104020 [Brettanomyces naardenensis]
MQKLQDRLDRAIATIDLSVEELPTFNKFKEDISQIRSSYWRIDGSSEPNPMECLTKMSSLSVDGRLVAIGSTSDYDNLRIYDLDTNKTLMTHLNTITLPDIHSIQWLYDPSDDNGSSSSNDDDSIRFLLTGHIDGISNLTMIPIGDNSEIRNAQIIKRFNHKKHLNNAPDNHLVANNGKPTDVIYQQAVTPRSWKTCNKNSLISIYRENVFLWDTTRSRYPILTNKVKGISSFDANIENDGLLALTGTFGVSLFDMRSSGSDCFFIPDKLNKECTTVSWCKEDPNYLCSADLKDQMTVWDIRNLKPLATLDAHSDSITSIQWDNLGSIYSSSNDGRIIYWDLSNLNLSAGHEECIKCTTKNSFNMDFTYNEIGTCIPVSNSSVVAMLSVGNGMTLTMDETFLGLHSKVEKSSDGDRRSSAATLVEDASQPKYVRSRQRYSSDTLINM